MTAVLILDGLETLLARARARILFFVLFSMVLFQAQAAILFSDSFSYADGPLIAASMDKWTTSNGNPAEVDVSAGAIRLTESGSEAISILLTGQPYATGALYAGFTVKFSALPSGAGNYFASFSTGPRSLGRVFATTKDAADGTFRIGITTAAPAPEEIVPVNLVLGTPYRIVLHYIPADADAYVWVDPVTEDIGGVRALDSTFPAPISSFAFRQSLASGDGMGDMVVDDLVVATTFDEVKDAPQKQLWQYTLQNEGVTITRYLGGDPVVIVPETIGGLPVKGLARGAFQSLFLPVASITLPAGVTNIGDGEFSAMFRLTNVTFLGRIAVIPDGAFNNCPNLLTVTHPDSVTWIGDFAFQNCLRLTGIRLPEGLTRIGAYAFNGCFGLTDVVLPQSLSFLGPVAFANCPRLTRVAIPRNVATIGLNAFDGSLNLEAIDVDPANAAFASVDGVLFDKSQTALLVCPGGKSGDFAIPSSVTRLAESVFSGCAKLTGVTIPGSVTTMGSRLFAGCTSLTRVTLPSQLTSIPNGMFFRCASLAAITLPAGVTRIGSQAFHSSGLVELAIPAGVTRIESETFAFCEKLERLAIPENLLFIGESALSDCSSLAELKIPRNVSTIQPAAIWGCTQLAVIAVDPLNMAYVSVDGVLFNRSMTTLLAYPAAKTGGYEIPASVRRLEANAFFGAAHLADFTIPDTVTALAAGVFQECRQLARIRVGRGITVIPQSTFSNCANLAAVILPDTLSTIGELAFFECPKLRSIIIPASVRTLGRGIFDSQFYWDVPQSLSSIYFQGSPPAASEQSLVHNSFEAGPTVYYPAGTAGWQETFAGRPAVALDASTPAIAPDFGMKDGQFGLSIVGAATLVVVVEACADLANPVWVPVGTHSVGDGAYGYSDPETATRTARFYRLRAP